MQSFQLHERAESVPTEASYVLTDWQKGYRSLPHEYSYEIDEIDGEIPVDLHGTLFRNGPGLLEVGGQRLHHPFDGDGMVCSIAFDNGRAYFRNRFVRTEAYCAEQKAGKMLYRGVFGTQKPGGWLANFLDFRLKNIANTQVIYWGGKLLALWEAAEPHRLDPHSLETIGKEYLDGVLHPGSAFAAHPWIDPETQTLVNFAIKPGLSTTITIYELDATGKVIREHAHAVPGFAFIHDFAITPNYCIFFQNPVAFNPIPFAIGLRGAGECLKFQPNKPTQIILIPRDGKSPVQTLQTQSGFVFHHSNAFEKDGAVCIDSVCYEAFPAVDPNSDYREVDFDALSPGHLYRFRLDLEGKKVDRHLIESRCCEFPYVHPSLAGRPYRYAYLGAAHRSQGNAPLQAILKVDLETSDRQLWSAAPHGYVGEPIFVPRAAQSYQDGLPTTSAVGDEDDGWILTLVYDSQRERSDLVILDAKDLREPIARLHLKHHVPYGLHGSFTPEYFGCAG
ncbi:carotenoid oxygenase family protein [Microcoleus sp. FACHB-1515]|uniref:carotenoid oxygenase family protein n=1 Tax=Cyanophyceae TaxID=3028117 RepID=UPI00168A044E|nr:carotenoid oxygenase family protein [Microcoleus sp. FACHB-1515]MBD2090278.1 carotenoid oxygenase family protein [Microcoleus sp. FACHB-1515]